MIQGEITKERMEQWKISSDDEEGFFELISPRKSDCEVLSIYRLNLKKGQLYKLETGCQEMNAVCVRGSCEVTALWTAGSGEAAAVKSAVCTAGSDEAAVPAFSEKMNKLDSFYAVSHMELQFKALEDMSLYIGAAIDEGYGKPYFREMDLSLPLGEIHQIHGCGAGEREVFMTINPETASSRLLAGVTWSRNGSWTSWPPHQHEQDLEEVYCYFDMPAPHFGLHLSYAQPGDIDGVVAHTVTDGTMILAPRGYHPTVASPGSVNTYFWVLGAHSHESRRYDLAVLDPERAALN